MLQTEFFHEVEANLVFQLFSDPMKQPPNFHILANDMIQIEWIKNKIANQKTTKQTIT